MLRRFLATSVCAAALISAAPAFALDAGSDAPIATAPAELVDFVAAPAPVGRLELAQLILTPQYAAIYGSKPVVATPAAFVANMVQFTQEFSASLAAGTLPDSATFVVAFEFQGGEGTATFQPTHMFSEFNAILAGNYSNATCGTQSNAESTPGLNVVNESPLGNGVFRFNINNSLCFTNNSALATYTPTNALNTGNHQLVLFGDMNCVLSARRCGGVFLDGAQIVSGFGDIGTWSANHNVAFSVNKFWINGQVFGNQDANSFGLGRLFIDLNAASPVVGTSHTFAYDITKFWNNGGPVDYGSDCSRPLGRVPIVCLTGPAATFLHNTGSAGVDFIADPEVTNSVTNKAYDVALPPGKIPDRPFVRWSYPYLFNGDCAESVGGHTCNTGKNAGHAIPAGDLLCFGVALTGNTTSFNDAVTAAGWTDELAGTATNAHFNNLAVFCKTVVTPVAAGADMPAITIGWTANATGWAEASITMFDIGAANGVTPVVDVAAATDSAISATTIPYPTVSATNAKSLWIGLSTTYDWGNATTPAALGPASTSTLVEKVAGAGNGNYLMIATENIAAGSISRTAQGNPGNKTINAVLVVH